METTFVLPYRGETYNLMIEHDVDLQPSLAELAEAFAGVVGVDSQAILNALETMQRIPHANKPMITFQTATVYG